MPKLVPHSDPANDIEQEARIEQASLDGNLQLLQSLVDDFLERHQTLWWEVSEKAVSHLEVLKWIYHRDKMISPNIWQYQYKHGSIESAEWLQQYDQPSKTDESYAFAYAIGAENVEMVFWLFQKAVNSFENRLDSCLKMILEYAHVKLLNELMICYADFTEDILKSIKSIIFSTPSLRNNTSRERRTQLVLWLTRHHIPIPSTWIIDIDDSVSWQELSLRNLLIHQRELTICNYYVLVGHQATLLSFQNSTSWLLDQGYVVSSSVWSNLAFYLDIEKLNWLYETCTSRNQQVLLDSHCYISPIIAYQYRHNKNYLITLEKVIEVMTWLFSYNCLLDNVKICREIAETGELTLLQWAVARNSPWDESVSATAARYGHLELLRWAIDNGCPWGERTVYHSMRHLNVFKYLVEEKRGTFQPNHTKLYTDDYPYSSTPSLETFLWALQNRPHFCAWKDLLHCTGFFYRENDMMQLEDWQTLQIALRNRLVDPVKIAKCIVETADYVFQILRDYQTGCYYCSKLIPNKRWQIIATLTDVLNRMATVYQLGFMKSGFSEQLVINVAKEMREYPKTFDWQRIKAATDQVQRFNAQSIASRQCRLDLFYEKMFYPYRLFQNYSWRN